MIDIKRNKIVLNRFMGIIFQLNQIIRNFSPVIFTQSDMIGKNQHPCFRTSDKDYNISVKLSDGSHSELFHEIFDSFLQKCDFFTKNTISVFGLFQSFLS